MHITAIISIIMGMILKTEINLNVHDAFLKGSWTIYAHLKSSIVTVYDSSHSFANKQYL
jgi:hypothetical protein